MPPEAASGTVVGAPDNFWQTLDCTDLIQFSWEDLVRLLESAVVVEKGFSLGDSLPTPFDPVVRNHGSILSLFFAVHFLGFGSPFQ